MAKDGRPRRLAHEERQALGRGNENVGRSSFLGGAVFGGSIAGARSDAQPVPAKLSERLLEIFLKIVGEGAERGNVDGDDTVGQGVGGVELGERVEDAEEGGECFAAAGGSGEERGMAGEDFGDGGALGRGEVGEALREPSGELGVQSREELGLGERGCGDGDVISHCLPKDEHEWTGLRRGRKITGHRRGDGTWRGCRSRRGFCRGGYGRCGESGGRSRFRGGRSAGCCRRRFLGRCRG